MAHSTTFVAVDVGNTRIKLGLFSGRADASFPQPERTLALAPGDELDRLAQWLPRGARLPWLVASVNRPACARLCDWLAAHGHSDVRTLTRADLPLRVAVPQPDRVGIDRLATAAAANRLRQPERAAVVIDVGSAITVDLLSVDAEFLGGAILPGIALAARALHEFTDLLPLSPLAELDDPPDPLGTTTDAALRAGLYWGAVGGMRELIERLSRHDPDADVLLTGGAAPAVAELLAEGGRAVQFVPQLTLSGVALAWKP